MIEWNNYGMMDLLSDRLMEWRKDGICNHGIMAWWNDGMEEWKNDWIMEQRDGRMMEWRNNGII